MISHQHRRHFSSPSLVNRFQGTAPSVHAVCHHDHHTRSTLHIQDSPFWSDHRLFTLWTSSPAWSTTGHAPLTKHSNTHAMTAPHHRLSRCCMPSPSPVVSPTQQEPGRHAPHHALCDHAGISQAVRRFTSSSQTRPRRCRVSNPARSGTQNFLLFTLLGLLLFCSICPGANASTLFSRPPRHVSPRAELLIDRTPKPVPHMALNIRQDAGSDASATISNRASSSNLAVAPGATNSLPRPFDSNLGNNFTASTCPEFFETFLHNDTFNDCLPFSLLLQTSNSFFEASQSLVRLSQTLDATCSVDYAQCSSLMSSLATQIQATSNCGADFAMQNPMVLQAYHGFMAYDPLYHAGCLTDSSSSQGSYCFAEAITNTSAPTSSYVYYLPLGVQLPAGTRPTCNTCLRDTMAIFATAASNHSQSLAADYPAAAQQIDMGCGPTFVQSSITPSSAAPSLTPPPVGGAWTIFLLAMLAFMY